MLCWQPLRPLIPGSILPGESEHRAFFLASLLWERNDPLAPLCFLPASHQGALGPPFQAPEAFLLIYPLMICDQEKPFTELPPRPGVSQEPHQAHPSTFFGAKDRSAIPGSVIFMLETSGMPFDLFVILTIFSGLCLFSRL